jgi:DNA-binding response OmpR family regulator
MNSQRKVLLIDNASDRKERIKALADHGYSVFPALRMDEARSRCTRGGYDLVVVNTGNNPEQALEFCDDVRRQCPKQLLLLTSDATIDREGTRTADFASAA